MASVFKVLLVIFLVLFVITLLVALIQGIRVKNKSSKIWGMSSLIMVVLAVGSFWGASASRHASPSHSQSSASSSSVSSSESTSSATSKLTDKQKRAQHSSMVSQKHQDQREQAFESSDSRRRERENQREEKMFAKRGTDKKGYAEKIQGIPDQSSHVVKKVTYDGKNQTVATISNDLTMGNRRENEHNAFIVWSGIKRLAFLHHVKTDITIKNAKGKEIANTNNNRFNYLD
ncbi:hypothetical protein MOO44_01835 [Nicoliella spurrieriana]|uniref:Uncharacterized protein n=1 Tax=Nicoliella spurrieriana TaxID=2925830 RepID=A0A976X5U6_9LACO|nr:hypothetical protein [Nicoliella spurrieriana]UQS86942.1 hypothetical protein MOO44_01835 [Nicoliella spurrieriana]